MTTHSHCNKVLTDTTEKTQTDNAGPERNSLVAWLIGLPVAAFALLMIVGSLLSTPQSKNQWIAREAIKVCNKEVARAPEDRKRPDLTPKDCADLAAAFRNQYGTTE